MLWINFSFRSLEKLQDFVVDFDGPEKFHFPSFGSDDLRVPFPFLQFR